MKQLHLANVHRALGAQFIEFAGWEMPLSYTTLAEEHLAVRNAVGLFDVSHMGEFDVKGPGAMNFLQHVTSNDVSKLAVGGGQYSTVTNERGGTKDDIMVYRTGEDDFLVVCNAANVEKLNGWIEKQKEPEVEIDDTTMTTTLFALQGPRAQSTLQKLTDSDLNLIKRFKIASITISGIKALVSRSGYTGEDGFEIFLTGEPIHRATRAERLWKALLNAGRDLGIKPCGLGARDTTRLEAGLCLYGNELTEEITPLEARIEFVVKFDKGDFMGREPLVEQKNSGLKRMRIGLRMLEAGVPRNDYGIFRDGMEIGSVTSGTFSPLLRVGIAMGYVVPDVKDGDDLSIEIHEKKRMAKVVSWPFYDPDKYGRLRK